MMLKKKCINDYRKNYIYVTFNTRNFMSQNFLLVFKKPTLALLKHNK